MINVTYKIKCLNYQATDDSVSMSIEYARYENESSPLKNYFCIRKFNELPYDAAKRLGLNNPSGTTFLGRDITVILGDNNIGEPIPVQVCSAIDAMVQITGPEKMQKQMLELTNKINKVRQEARPYCMGCVIP